MSIVTISGNTGAGATEIGRIVAQQLGFDYVDRQILTEAARALGVRNATSPAATSARRRRRCGSGWHLSSRTSSSARPWQAPPIRLGTGGLEALMAASYREAASLPRGRTRAHRRPI